MRTSTTWLPAVALLAFAACPPAAKTERLELTPSALALQTGEARVVSGRLVVVEDGTVAPLTGATWTSSDEAVATVAANADGSATVTAVAAGSATITASLRSLTATVSVVVTAKPRNLLRLELTPASPSLAVGTSLQLTATGIYTDDSREDLTGSVTWRTSSESTLGVTPGGLVTGVAMGNATISANLGSITGNLSVTVTDAVLARIEVTPTGATISRGFTVAMTATGVFTDSTTQDLTSQVTWSSANMAVATVSAAGVVTGVTAGTVAIRATRGSVTGETPVTVSSAELVAIDVTPANPSLPRGATQQLTATGRFSDNTTQDLTQQATWSSSSSGVVTVSDDAATKGLATARAQGSADALATIAGVTGRTTLTVTSATLTRIDVSPATPSVVKGLTRAFTAAGVYSDGSTADLTGVVLWSSSDTAVASISNAQGSYGLARALGEGTATITATRGGVSGTTTITVTAAELVSLAVTPATASVPLGLTQDYVATGTYTDGSTQDVTTTVTWSVTNAAAATISNAAGSNGRLTPVAIGSTTVRATSGSIIASATASIVAARLVSIDVTPATPTLAKGATQALVATGRYTDNSTQNLTSSATWSSDTTTVATVTTSGTRGVVTAVDVGSAVITATSGTISGSTTVTVTAAALVSLAVTPASPSVAKGLAQAFVATGTYSDATTAVLTDQVTWTSSNTATATIGNMAGTYGVATTLAEGNSTITATLGTLSATAALTVTAPAVVSIAVTGAPASLRRGDTAQLTATATYTDATTADVTATATWSSSAASIASVSDAAGTKGLVTGVAVGAATITAAVGTVSGTADVTVVPPTLTAITVTPATPSLAVGQTQAFVATGSYSDSTTAVITTTVTWASSSTAVATVSNTAGTQGLAAAVSQGSTTISATLGTVSGSTTLTVTPLALSSIAVTPATPSIVEGLGQAFVATATYTDNSTADVTASATWTSSNTAAATVSDAAGTKGQATGVAPGTSTITAALGTVSGSATLTVVARSITAIAVAPAAPSVAKGRTQVFTATATYDNATTGDVTTSVAWSSGTTTVATIGAGTGVATAVGEGTSVITATSGSVSGTATLTVTAAVLDAIAISGLPTTFRKGDTASLVATGTYSDATTQVLTGTATWASSAAGVASVSDAAGTKGTLTGVTEGSANITATVGSVVGTLAVTVLPPSLVSIAVTPANPSVNVGATQQLVATGTFSDSSTQNVSSTATWVSQTTTVATVSTSGLVTAVAAGTSQVDATIGSVTGSTTVTVVNPPPTVTATSPADAATGASTVPTISVTFDRAMNQSTLTAQASAGACSGSIQVSRNNFTTCIGFSAPTFPTTSRVSLVPVTALVDGTTYQVRVTTAAQSALGAALAATFTQATGFTTRIGARCGTNVVISQVYGGGGNSGAPYTHDFIELHNPTAGDIPVGDWAVQYASATGATWNVTTIPAGTVIPAGGYFLVRQNGGTVGVALPTPDLIGNASMSATDGKVALTNTNAALTDATPTSTAIVDFVGFGTAGFSEAAPTGRLSNGTAALRRNSGCADANNNSTDFDVLAPSPRNSATPAINCACSINGLGSMTDEADFCNLQFPATLSVTPGGTTAMVYGQLWENGVTQAAGAAPQVRAQIGYGSPLLNPQSQSGWTWTNATYNAQVGENDEYQLMLTAPTTAGVYAYTTRFSFDGVNWTYCDLNGAGSNTGLAFELEQLGVMTVAP